MKNLTQKFSFFLLSSAFLFDANALDHERIEELKHAVVSIKLQESNAAYTNPMSGDGTGFVIDSDKGIILTNRHIASVDRVSNYKAMFFGGSRTDLKLIWNDPHHDFAFLQVDPQSLPKDVPHLKFSLPKIGETVLIIGNNEANSFSVQTGTITDLFAIDTADNYAPQHTIRMSMNTVGGSSGSPVFNQQGEVVGLNFASMSTAAMSVPVSYIQDALTEISNGRIPSRYSLGACFKLLNLDDARDYYKYDDSLAKETIGKTPGTQNKILQVSSILPATPAMKVLKVGDIIESIEGEIIGPDSYSLEKTLNALQGKSVSLTVYRKGEKHEIKVPTFDLNAAECTQFLNFGNSIITPSNFHVSFVTGLPLGSICMTHFPNGSLFNEIQQTFMFEEIDGLPIKTLDDVKKAISHVTKAQKFNYVGRFFGNIGVSSNQSKMIFEAEYRSHYYGKPFQISFNPEKMDWFRHEIEL